MLLIYSATGCSCDVITRRQSENKSFLGMCQILLLRISLGRTWLNLGTEVCLESALDLERI